MSERKGFKLPKLPELPLPPRGFGLTSGRAGERRGGTPRTEAERRARHFSLPFSSGSNPGPDLEQFLPALPPDLPLPRFVVEQMKK